MIPALHFAFLLCIGQTDSVSTDELDGYIEQVVKARKACGPTAVWYCLCRLGQKPKLAEVWSQANIEENGTSIQNLLELFNSCNVPAHALVGDPRRLDDLPVPGILIVDDTHCIVFDGLEPDGQKVRYFEPALGEMRSVSRELIESHWSGEAIVFQRPMLSRRGFGATIFLATLAFLSFAAATRWLVSHRRPLATR